MDGLTNRRLKEAEMLQERAYTSAGETLSIDTIEESIAFCTDHRGRNNIQC